MKILYQDILNFLNEQPSKIDVSKKLFQLGHEHEIDGDIFEMEFTPNRGDCLSVMGLARDLNVFFSNKNSLSLYQENIENLEINFNNLAIQDCPTISFLEIEIDGEIKKYKPYLENYFKSLGHKKTNFFTDISNYVSYELGQPTHCYDKNLINGELIFENKLCDESFQTLHEKNIHLKQKNCVFTLNNKIINLAGVMGGASTACSSSTNKVLIECAFFNPESIIGKSVKYNLISDASYKFERGVDRSNQETVLRRFIAIVQDHANIKDIKIRTFNYTEIEKKYLKVDEIKIKEIIGIDIKKSEYISLLKKLKFTFEGDKLLIPAHRHDIEFKNDIAEEVARVIGYNNIKENPFSLPGKNSNKAFNKIKYIKSLLINNGFNETINFPFSSENTETSIGIDNPLDSNKSNFRTSLKNSLVENFQYNQRRQKESIKLFEISDIYTINQEISYKKKLGIIVGGRKGMNYQEFSQKLDGVYLEDLLNNNLEKKFFNAQEISKIKLDTKKKDKVYYIEVYINDIPEAFFSENMNINFVTNFSKYIPISEFPSSNRDFSFLITRPEAINKITNYFSDLNDEIIKDSFIFDFYHNMDENKIKLGYRIVFQSKDSTLSDININLKVKEILNPILSIEGVSIPGLSLNE